MCFELFFDRFLDMQKCVDMLCQNAIESIVQERYF